MKKGMYIAFAVVLAAGMTIIQAAVAGSAGRKNAATAFVASRDIKAGDILNENDTGAVRIFVEEGGVIELPALAEILGRTASREIPAGAVITLGDVYDDMENYEGMRMLAVEVGGSSFNAGDLEEGDDADIFIIPEIDDLNEMQLIWLNSVLGQAGVEYIPGRDPGILIENIRIVFIDTATGQSAKYVSIRVPVPLDRAIAFLEHISTVEFIKR
ncbi:MAG: hypothetical protein JXB33_01140 [Clostridia bacterium]|nr:hypothetical protein [Clostridia bacterium]